MFTKASVNVVAFCDLRFHEGGCIVSGWPRKSLECQETKKLTQGDKAKIQFRLCLDVLSDLPPHLAAQLLCTHI